MSVRIVLALVICSALMPGAGGPVGVITAVGSIRVDGAEVRGVGTVHNGSSVETIENPSQLILSNGTRFDLAANSRAQVYDDHAALERGASQVHASQEYSIEVNSLSIVAAPASTIRVFGAGGSRLRVFAVKGVAEVARASGVMIARVSPDAPLDFEQQSAGATGPIKLSGKLEKQGNRYVLTDVTTKTAFEIQGNNLGKSVGQCIAATGSSDPTSGRLIHVASYSSVSCKSLAGGGTGGANGGGNGGGNGGSNGGVANGGGANGGANGAGAPPIPAGGGLSGGAIAGIAAGGAAGAGLGGAAAAGAFSGGRAAPVSPQ